ncbi:hypothetical protein R1flu_013364 [Riccia fluitans]|uniref:Uncharacterized protein n=1 Tax=Riccia fluitans TaxID=41844 RepID=A0ABD1YD61_9MARC
MVELWSDGTTQLSPYHRGRGFPVDIRYRRCIRPGLHGDEDTRSRARWRVQADVRERVRRRGAYGLILPHRERDVSVEHYSIAVASMLTMIGMAC